MINPVFHNTGGIFTTTDWSSFADSWIAAFKTWSGIGTTSQIGVKIYDVAGPPPHEPIVEKLVNPGVAAGVGSPREIAVCLSFNALPATKRTRGRLYVPFYWLFPASSLADRPNATVRAKVGSLAGVLAGLGGVDIDWSVHSPTTGQTKKVEHWWVDDEWDTQRRRGLLATTRDEGTVSG
jgi:hypothetical protein